jgi:regulator of protease activity HflC (stomatin/prohibitin superfamily)
MFLFIAGIVVAVVGAILILVGKLEPERRGDAPTNLRPWGIGVVAVALVLGIFSTFTTVDARSLGIQTSMGRYKGVVSSGFHLTAPWSSVEEWTTRNQTIDFAGNDEGDRDNYRDEAAITVRLGNQSTALVDARVSWAVADSSTDTKAQEERIKKLWTQYKSFDDMVRDYAVPAARSATNTAFDGYDPFRGLDEKNADNPYVPLADWSRKITDTLRPLYTDRGLTLISVQVTQVRYDDKTEAKLRQYSDAVADTRIKAQDVKTAEQEALASKQRSTQAAPGCEALIRDLAAKDQLKNLPAGWQCPGSPGGAVIVGQK